MAKGNIAKAETYEKLMKLFPGSFMYNGGKELRIPVTEEGESLQLKLVLTAAKTAVSNGEDVALPGEVTTSNSVTEMPPEGLPWDEEPKQPVQVTDEEKASIQDLMSKLGL